MDFYPEPEQVCVDRKETRSLLLIYLCLAGRPNIGVLAQLPSARWYGGGRNGLTLFALLLVAVRWICV
ncbi:hypothetical protein BDU57DRAFT_524837 [Ampelomyces quisqualis]|uniref:Uncharacterized protein n=1 Tax=Ampelomyces quisqualis TaxID=50730 RepID=A0A6A5Q6E3_AMPQU|nr:hypothetical protein BDU57DRAFT_524837 [Ampelomyces quisqualis]